jgi:hypothetical protein
MAKMISDPPVLRPAAPAFKGAQTTKAAKQNSEPNQQQIV